MLERDEDEERDEFMRAFEAFDAGDLTAANAHEFELPEPPAKKEAEGGASGADLAERGGQQPGKADSAGGGGAEQDRSASRERGQDGRFAKGGASGRPAAAGQQPQATSNADPAAAQQPKATDAPASATQPEPAPQGLSARAAAAWATATPEAREYIRETEGVLERVADGFKPIFEEAREHKLPWNEYAKRLVNADKFIRKSPQDAMLWLAETHGVDLDELADFAAARRVGMTPKQNQAPELHRVVQPLADEVKEIRSRLAQREQYEQQQADRMASERRAAAKREYDAFAAKAEHWNEVESAVIQAIPILRAAKPDASVTDILQAAYDTAAWSNPTVREKLLAAQQRKAQDAGRSQRSRTIESVTSHAGAPSVTSRKPSNGATADPLRDEIAAHWDAYESR